MQTQLLHSLTASIAAKRDFAAAAGEAVCRLARWMTETIRAGNTIYLCGNGGSAADAQHVAGEFINRFLINRRPLPAVALTTDTSVITAIANDFSYDDIFAKQVEALARPGDLLIGISTSGNSENIIRAVLAAHDKKTRSAALTGGSGGRLIELADLALNVPAHKTPHIQETHIWVLHFLCEMVEQELFGEETETALV